MLLFHDPGDTRPLHFVGAAGAGMSALAALLVRRRIAVNGCDVNPVGAADLVALGVPVAAGHDPSHVAGARALVYSSAISPDHPELVQARRAGVPVMRRAEALAEAVRGGRVVAVAGTHGKTTTTAMVTEALASAGYDPTGVAGGRVASWNGNLRRGSDALFVVEADEYDRSFLALTPDVAVVTNVEAEHLDTYRDIDEVLAAFAAFCAPASTVVLCADDRGAASLAMPVGANIIRYGIDTGDVRLAARDLRTEGGVSMFTVWYDGVAAGEVHLRVPGEHNVRNALAAVAVGIAWGATVPMMAPGLASFGGVERRFQRLGEVAGVVIVDDYAHHPTEIRATLAAARGAYPGRRLVVAFQPHLYTRTRALAGDFGAALAGADEVLLADIYAAREEPIEGVTSELIADALRAAGSQASWMGPRASMAAALAARVKAGDVVLTVGAGDITRVGPGLLARLSSRAAPDGYSDDA